MRTLILTVIGATLAASVAGADDTKRYQPAVRRAGDVARVVVEGEHFTATLTHRADVLEVLGFFRRKKLFSVVDRVLLGLLRGERQAERGAACFCAPEAQIALYDRDGKLLLNLLVHPEDRSGQHGKSSVYYPGAGEGIKPNSFPIDVLGTTRRDLDALLDRLWREQLARRVTRVGKLTRDGKGWILEDDHGAGRLTLEGEEIPAKLAAQRVLVWGVQRDAGSPVHVDCVVGPAPGRPRLHAAVEVQRGKPSRDELLLAVVEDPEDAELHSTGFAVGVPRDGKLRYDLQPERTPTRLVCWLDRNANGQLDAGEPRALSETLTLDGGAWTRPDGSAVAGTWTVALTMPAR